MAGQIDVEKRRKFVDAWHACGGSPTAVAEKLRLGIRNVYRMRAILADAGVVLQTDPGARSNGDPSWRAQPPKWPKRREITIKDRCLFVGSDAHFWPDLISLAWKAFCILGKKLEPQYAILNGDTADGARISRHDPICWESRPSMDEELECIDERLNEFVKASPNTKRLWTLGNHCTRFDRYLAVRAPEMRNVRGSSLQDHFPGWPMSWSVMVNENISPLIVTHAFRNGQHATYNNVLHAGISIVTGHLHAQNVRPFTDYRGTRYGIDAGALADVPGPQFGYTLDNPLNWRSGFAVLTFDKKGHLLPPELCEVQTRGKEQIAYFRGKVIAEGALDG